MTCRWRGPKGGLSRPRASLGPAHAQTKSKGEAYREERCARYRPARTFCPRRTPGDGRAGWGTWHPRGGNLQGLRWAHWRWKQDAGPSPPGRTLGGMDRAHARSREASRTRIHMGKERDENILDLVGTNPYLRMWLTLKLILRDKIITMVSNDT